MIGGRGEIQAGEKEKIMEGEEAKKAEAKLAELKAELKDLEMRNPAHCSDTRGYVGHQMTPQLLQRIEDLEEEIEGLEKKLGAQ